jgi:hypothetical protein
MEILSIRVQGMTETIIVSNVDRQLASRTMQPLRSYSMEPVSSTIGQLNSVYAVGSAVGKFPMWFLGCHTYAEILPLQSK